MPDDGNHSPSAIKPAAEKHNSTEMSFLKDVREYPDSGIAARYKRPGLSVRQGQRLKDELVAKGMIEEHQETTGTGRLSRVSLTTQGNELVSQAGRL